MKRFAFIFCCLVAGCYHLEREDSLVAIQIQDRNGLTETLRTPDRLEMYENVDFFSAQPYKKILRVFKKEGKSHSKITTYHPNGVIWQYLEAEELRAHGAYKEWYPNGQLKIEARVIGGTADVVPGSQHDWLFDGTSRVWDEQGHLIADIPYRQGTLDGKSTYFYPSGQIEKEFPYLQNKLDGEALEYHPNGALKAKTSYRKGNKEGLSVGHFENGKLAWSEEYAEDLLVKGSYFDRNGNPISEVVDGLGFRALFESATLSYLIQIRQGNPEGKVQKFTPEGELLSSYHMKHGKKYGEEIEYFLSFQRTDGKTDLLPKLSVQWDDDAIHGIAKTWYPNGQLQSHREFCRNKKTGPALSWYCDGSLMLLEEYEENRLVKGQYYRKNGRDPVSSVIQGNGIAMLYDEQGIFLRKITYAKGEPVEPEN